MKFTNETHKQILADIHEEVIRHIDGRDSSLRSPYDDGWMDAINLVDGIVNKWFIAQRDADISESEFIFADGCDLNEAYINLLEGISELVDSKKDGSATYDSGWFDAMIGAEYLIKNVFKELRKNAEKRAEKNADILNAQPKVKGIVVMVRGKPIYQPMETGNKATGNETAEKPTGSTVDHPAHYNSGKIEVIDFLEDQNLPFHLANAVKYICRAGKKNPYKVAEDLQKAIWYISRYIGLVEEKPEPKSANETGGSDHV